MSRPSTTQLQRSNFRWGLVTLLIIGVGTYLGFTKALPFGHHYEVRAVFSSAATQLKKNSAVRVAGVNVGKVTDVRRGPGTTVVVRMRVDDKGRPFHTDATMKIRPRLFLEGNFFVDVDPGTPRSAEIPDGGTVPLGQTAIPVQFDQVLDTFDRDGREELRTTVRELSTSLADGGASSLAQTFAVAPKGLTGLAASAAAARGVQADDLSRYIADQAVVSRAVADDPAALAGLVRGLDRTLSALGDRAQPLGRSLTLLQTALAGALAAEDDGRAVVAPVRRLAAALHPALERAPRTLRLANAVLRDAQPLLRDDQLPRLTRTLTPAAQDLVAQIPSLDHLFTRTRPVAQCLQDNVVPTLLKRVDDGRLSTGLPVWKELVRFPVGLASASANFNGNGNSLRLITGAGEHSIATNSPSLGEVVTSLAQPLSGARPRWRPGHAPPLRPDVDCTTQNAPSLAAEAVPAPAATRHAQPLAASPKLHRTVTDAVRRLLRKERAR